MAAMSAFFFLAISVHGSPHQSRVHTLDAGDEPTETPTPDDQPSTAADLAFAMTGKNGYSHTDWYDLDKFVTLDHSMASNASAATEEGSGDSFVDERVASLPSYVAGCEQNDDGDTILTCRNQTAEFALLSKLDLKELHSPPAQEVRIVLGVMSADGWKGRRHAHRVSWMSHRPLVCAPSQNFGDDGCSIVARFIHNDDDGSGRTAQEVRAALDDESNKFGDIFWMKGTLGNKVRYWHKAARNPKAFPKLTHVGKVDSDTYVSPARLIMQMDSFGALNPEDSVYAGRFIMGSSGICKKDRSDFDPGCACPPRNVFEAKLAAKASFGTTFQTPDPPRSHAPAGTPTSAVQTDNLCRMSYQGGCWPYAQGGFYLVSRSLSSRLEDKFTSCHWGGYGLEDANIGHLIAKVAYNNHSVLALDLNGSAMACQQQLTEHRPFYHMYYEWGKLWKETGGREPRCGGRLERQTPNQP
jgi:hypothetical protein